MTDDATINVRYMVDDVAAAIDFYTGHLGFTVLTSFPPAPLKNKGNISQIATSVGGGWP